MTAFAAGDRVFPGPETLAEYGIDWEKRHDHAWGGTVVMVMPVPLADGGIALLIDWDNGERHDVPAAELIPEAEAGA